MPYVQEISWDPERNNLIVQHEDDDLNSDSDESNHRVISTFGVSYKVTTSGLGRFVGSLFGTGVGNWVEGNIDTVKYGFSDIGNI